MNEAGFQLTIVVVNTSMALSWSRKSFNTIRKKRSIIELRQY